MPVKLPEPEGTNMSKIIKLQDGTPQIVADEWTVLRAPEGGELAQGEVDAAARAIVPLAYWQANREALASRARAGTLAVWLAPDDEPSALADDLASLPLVAVDFPVFRDGRAIAPPSCCASAWASRANCAPSATCCATSSTSCAVAVSTPSPCAPTRASTTRSTASARSACATRAPSTNRARCSAASAPPR